MIRMASLDKEDLYLWWPTHSQSFKILIETNETRGSKQDFDVRLDFFRLLMKSSSSFPTVRLHVRLESRRYSKKSNESIGCPHAASSSRSGRLAEYQQGRLAPGLSS